MTLYIRPRNEERVLLDTAKAALDFEGQRLSLTGATLECYDVDWVVAPGHVGIESPSPRPCRVLRLTDPFTGFRIEVPFVESDAVAMAFGDSDDRRRTRKLRRLLGL